MSIKKYHIITCIRHMFREENGGKKENVQAQLEAA